MPAFVIYRSQLLCLHEVRETVNEHQSCLFVCVALFFSLLITSWDTVDRVVVKGDILWCVQYWRIQIKNTKVCVWQVLWAMKNSYVHVDPQNLTWNNFTAKIFRIRYCVPYYVEEMLASLITFAGVWCCVRLFIPSQEIRKLLYNGKNYYADLLHRHNLGRDLIMQSTPCPEDPHIIAAGIDDKCALLSLVGSTEESSVPEEEEDASEDNQSDSLRRRKSSDEKDSKAVSSDQSPLLG